MCVECEVARDEFADEHNGMRYPPGSLSEMLSNCISEGEHSDADGKWVIAPEDARWQAMLDAMAARKAGLDALAAGKDGTDA